MTDIETPVPSKAGLRKVGRYVVMALLGVWVISQILIPMRHHLYPGDTSWTEQGHRFAWQMKLRDKASVAEFLVLDPATNRSWRVDNTRYLTARQIRKMSNRPDMILQFAHHISDVWQSRRGVENPEVYAIVWASLNGRSPDLLIDPGRDLAAVERNLLPADWIFPLTTELP